MKANFSPISFKSELLISNRAKVRGIARQEQVLKDNFRAMTGDDNSLMIMTTNKNSDEDIFELYDENKNVVASYNAPLSKYAQSTTTDKLSQRLANIYEVLKIKEAFNSIINMLQEYKASQLGELEEIQNNPNLTKKRKAELSEIKKQSIKFLKKDIEYQTRSCAIECDSYESLHGMNNALN